MKTFGQFVESINYPPIVDGFFIRDYIAKYHQAEFVDYWRIGDKYELRQIPVALLKDEWGAYQPLIDQYAKINSQTIPPIVVDSRGSIVDGCHRVVAAKKQGLKTIPAYVEIGNEIHEPQEE